jgi:hypothetical protein
MVALSIRRVKPRVHILCQLIELDEIKGDDSGMSGNRGALGESPARPLSASTIVARSCIVPHLGGIVKEHRFTSILCGLVLLEKTKIYLAT